MAPASLKRGTAEQNSAGRWGAGDTFEHSGFDVAFPILDVAVNEASSIWNIGRDIRSCWQSKGMKLAP